MSKFLPLPSQERLQELFDYSVITGELRWKTKPSPRSNKIKPGSLCGCLDGGVGFKVTLDGKNYGAHRLIWKLVTGNDPGQLEVDHSDTDSSNNSWHNLRLADRSENACNRSKMKNNTTGFKGVSLTPSGKFRVQIMRHGVNYRPAPFDTLEEAHAAYCKAAEELHGEFARSC